MNFLWFLDPSSPLQWTFMAFLMVVISFTIVVLYEESPSFRYKLKFCLYVVLVSIVMAVFLPISLLRPRNVKNTVWTIPFLRPISKVLGLRWEVQGAENLEKDESCVFICNHQSVLDILGMCEIWPQIKRCAPVAKKEVLYVFPFGLVAWLCGTVFIDRKNSTQSRTQISSSAESLHKNKTKLWLFPEGTRYKGETLLPFKKGAFHIAVQNKLPIAPVVISPYTFVDDKQPSFNSGKMIISVLPPIETEGLQPEQINDFIEETRNKMVKEFERISQLVNKANNVHHKSTNHSSKNGGPVPVSPVTFGEAKEAFN